VSERRYPEPLVGLREDPRRWVRNQTQALVISIPASHVMVLAWIAVYFIAFELVHPIKHYWDTLLSRHIHLLSAGSLEHLRAQPSEAAASPTCDDDGAVPAVQPVQAQAQADPLGSAVIGRVVLTLLLMIPLFHRTGAADTTSSSTGFTPARWRPSIGAHPSLAAKLYSDQWTTKVVVVAAGFLGRRPMFPVFAFVLEFFAERRVARGKTDHWWQPAPFRAMVREQAKEGVTEAQRRQAQRNRSVTVLMIGGVLVTLALAGYGVYILEH